MKLQIISNQRRQMKTMRYYFNWVFPSTSASKESACNAGEPGLIPGSGRSAGEGIPLTSLAKIWSWIMPDICKNSGNLMHCSTEGMIGSFFWKEQKECFSVLLRKMQHMHYLWPIGFLLGVYPKETFTRSIRR